MRVCLGKLNIQVDNNFANRFRGARDVTWLRGRLIIVDPYDLIQIMLAEGNDHENRLR